MENLKNIVFTLVLLFSIGCSGGGSDSKQAEELLKSSADLGVGSTSFQNGGEISKKYVCKNKGGEDISPQVSWKAVDGAKSYAIVMDDEVPPCGKGDKACRHWGVFNIPSTVTSLKEGEDLSKIEGVTIGKTYNGKVDYEGPCPPNAHVYKLTVFALKEGMPKIGNGEGLTRSQFIKKYKDFILGYGTISGKFNPSK
jgi:Raf kinase inhibitor-like YbhB/YbcL family protein